MDVYAARQPIFDTAHNVYGYELLCRQNEENFYVGTDDNAATANLINNTFLVMDLKEMTSGTKAFINFSRDLLVKKIPLLLPKEHLVVEILERVDPDDEVIEACRELKKMGYTLALDDFVMRDDYYPLIELADIIKVTYTDYTEEEHKKLIRLFKGKKMLVERIETREELDKALSLGYKLFQGYFFSKPIMMKGKELPTFNPVLKKILAELTNAEPTYKNMTAVIETDLPLSYKFLKLANTMQFGSRFTVDTIDSALVRMGMEEIRKWIYLLMLKEFQQPQSDEMIRFSLIRARMMELIAMETGERKKRSDYFLAGLFSMLDAILAKPFIQLLKDLPLSSSVEKTLLGEGTLLGQWLQCIKLFEKGQVTSSEECPTTLSIEILTTLYHQSIRWVNELENNN